MRRAARAPGHTRAARGTRSAGPAPEPGDADAAREAALRLLERTRRTRLDLRRRLVQRGFSRAVIEEVLERLSCVGLVDDVEYARAYLAGRWGRGPAAWKRLAQALRARGVALEDVEAARVRLVDQVGRIDERSGACKVVAAAARRYRGLDPRLRRQRLYALLARRGYDADTIEDVLREEAGE